MQSSLSLWFILCLAVAFSTSAASETDLVNGDELETIESLIDPTTEGVPVADYPAGLDRGRRQSDPNATINIIFNFFLRVLELTFGHIPTQLNESLMNQMGKIATDPPAAGSGSTPASVVNTTPTIQIVPDSEMQQPTGQTYRRKQLENGKNVRLVVPRNQYKKYRACRQMDLKPSCDWYLKSLRRETDPNKKTLMGYFCKQVLSERKIGK